MSSCDSESFIGQRERTRDEVPARPDSRIASKPRARKSKSKGLQASCSFVAGRVFGDDALQQGAFRLEQSLRHAENRIDAQAIRGVLQGDDLAMISRRMRCVDISA